MGTLTIEANGADETESFLYEVFLEDENQDHKTELIVSVKGDDGSTTIAISPIKCTVTDMSEWTWKYYNKGTADKEACCTISNDYITAEKTIAQKIDERLARFPH